VWATIGQAAECIDSMRVPVNKKERLNRVGNVPYYGANGRVGFIDDYIFNEPLVLVVEDETFTGRELPFSYKIAGKSWVNNHAHVLRPTDMVTLDYFNYALSFYPFTPLTTGTTGRKKLTQLALVTAPLGIPPKAEQLRIVAEVDRRLSIIRETVSQVDANLQRSERLRQSILSKAFIGCFTADYEHKKLSGGILNV
jgi:type I restriction enzyme, S subunit